MFDPSRAAAPGQPLGSGECGDDRCRRPSRRLRRLRPGFRLRGSRACRAGRHATLLWPCGSFRRSRSSRPGAVTVTVTASSEKSVSSSHSPCEIRRTSGIEVSRAGCRYVCPAGEERSQRGVDARSRPGRLCRLGLDVGRYTTSVCHVESRASGRRDERDGAPQVGGGIERGGRDSGEAFGADQRAVSRIRDAQVEGGGFRRGDGVTEFPAERGVLRRNLCECHLDRCLGCCCGGLHDVARCRSQRAGRSVACP